MVEILTHYSNLKNEEDKKVFNKLIGNGAINFREQEIKDLNLREINLKNCGFYGSKIIDCDLTNAQFDQNLSEVSFYNVKLSDDFTLTEINGHKNLVKLYENPTLPQRHKNILANILLDRVNLCGVTLFENFVIPPNKNDRDLVKRYSDFPEERENLNKLFSIMPLELDLAGDGLNGLDLQGINLIKSKLKNVEFKSSILFEGFKVPNYKYSVDLMKWYSNSKDPKEKRNLNRLFNIYSRHLTFADLRNLDLQEMDLSKAELNGAQFQGSTLFEGFKVPDYENDAELIRFYSDSKDPKVTRSLNRLFDIIGINLRDADLKGLDLEGINLTCAGHENTDFSGCNLINSTYSEYTGIFNQDANLNGTQWSEDFIFPLSKFSTRDEIEKAYVQIAKTDRQKYFFKRACKLSCEHLFDQINFSDTSN